MLHEELKPVGEVFEISVEKVKIREGRYRKDMGDIQSLAESIKTVGQLIPIIITEDLVLVAGERRLRACQHLKLPTIQAVIQTTKELDSRVIEILENLARKEFEWQEEVLAKDDLHSMLLAKYGKKWSERKTAKETGLSAAGIITDLNLAEAYKTDPEMFARCKDKQSAMKVLQKYKIDEAASALALRKSKTNYGLRAKNLFFLGDALDLIQKLPSGSKAIVNALITDPPYGIGLSEVKKVKYVEAMEIGAYEDDPQAIEDLLAKIVELASFVLKRDAHFAMFCRVENIDFVKDLWKKAGFMVDDLPAIWHASQGQTSHPDHWFARCYEPFIYGYRGEATLVEQGKSNVIICPRVTGSDKIHIVQKPLPVMEELIARMCMPGHVVLDPFAGVATTLVAAVKRGCQPIGFEKGPVNYDNGVLRLAEALKLKDAGRLDLMEKK